jgi:hypothetical protein
VPALFGSPDESSVWLVTFQISSWKDSALSTLAQARSTLLELSTVFGAIGFGSSILGSISVSGSDVDSGEAAGWLPFSDIVVFWNKDSHRQRLRIILVCPSVSKDLKLDWIRIFLSLR